jgi:hypothetical protein
MIDSTSSPPAPEDRLSPTSIAKRLGVHVSTVWRWITHGVKVNGDRVHLDVFRVGGRAYVLAADLDAFHRATNARQKPPTERQGDANDVCESFGL